MLSAIAEHETRSANEVAHHRGDEHFVRPGEAGDSRADVHGDSADVPAMHLAFARVHGCTHADAKRLDAENGFST